MEMHTRVLDSIEDLKTCWNKVDVLLCPEQRCPGYLVGFAASDRGREAAQRLRYEVFNLELNEGLAESEATGLDQDRFDPQMTHILTLEAQTGRVVGTYRIQSVQDALGKEGLYSAQEYDLSPLEPYFDQALECGRACTARDHRKATALLALWQGMQVFMNLSHLRWPFGCCSLTSQDCLDGWKALATLRKRDCLHRELYLKAHSAFKCGEPCETDETIPLPKLFHTYMRLGGKVISEPALDREFGTIDFLVFMDGQQVNMSSLGLQK